MMLGVDRGLMVMAEGKVRNYSSHTGATFSQKFVALVQAKVEKEVAVGCYCCVLLYWVTITLFSLGKAGINPSSFCPHCLML